MGLPVQHKSAELQVTGEAMYTDDLSGPSGTLFAALVTSARAHAELVSMDAEKCAACPGFVRFICAKDIPGENHLGSIVHDEEVFVTSIIPHFGAILGLVVCASHEEAVYAAKQVVVTYKDLPAIISIEDAVIYNNLLKYCHLHIGY